MSGTTTTTTQQVEYQGNKYKVSQCFKCKKDIFLIKQGEKDGKTVWELHNLDGSLHVDAAKPFGGGGAPPPPVIVDVAYVPLVPANQPDAAQTNQTLIAGLLASGYEIAMNRQTHCPDREVDPTLGIVQVFFKRK